MEGLNKPLALADMCDLRLRIYVPGNLLDTSTYGFWGITQHCKMLKKICFDFGSKFVWDLGSADVLYQVLPNVICIATSVSERGLAIALSFNPVEILGGWSWPGAETTYDGHVPRHTQCSLQFPPNIETIAFQGFLVEHEYAAIKKYTKNG